MCSKVQDYAPSQALKIYSKPVTRKSGIKFDPHQVIDLVRRGSAPSCKTQAEKANIVTAFVEVCHARASFHSLCLIYYFIALLGNCH